MSLLGDVEEAAGRYHEAVSALEEARVILYERILAAAAEGIPLARVARSAGLSRERVRQIAEDAAVD